MAVRDPASGVYQLAELGVPGSAILSQVGFAGVAQEDKTASFTFLSISPISMCLTAANGAGPSDGAGPLGPASCETYVFLPLAGDETPGATKDTINMRPFWVNPLGSNTANHTGSWAYYGSNNGVLQVADVAFLKQAFSSLDFTPINLRFPFDS